MPAIEDNGPEVAAIINGAGFQIPTDAQFTQFQTAYGWGDHTTAGYLTSAPVASVAGETGAISAAALRIAINVEDGATADQTGAEIVSLVDAQLGGNTWQSGGGGAVDSVAGETGTITAAELRTAINVENGATADQTGAEIKAAYEAEANTNAFTDPLLTKLNGIASGAEVNTIESDPTGITGADQVSNMVSLTQAEYDAITPNATTLYIITG